jgi:uncharacterized surface protein with fasciclin (FAS1) repeats
MKKSFYLLISTVLSVLFIACGADNFDKEYQRPEWLEPPIYQLLQEEGNFNSFLKCVDKTLYARIFKSASNYTVFAPTDEAFALYLQETGNRTINDISAAEADTIVGYSMVFNTFEFGELTDILTKGWDTLASIKKKTAFYETLHKEYYNGDSIWVIDATSSNTAVIGENNYKFMPTYMAEIFNKRSLGAIDYESFYDRSYTGENVQRATVVKKNMYAENGIVHAVDRVNKPLPNLEKLMESKPDFSEFLKIINRKNTGGQYIYKSYLTASTLSNYYRELYPEKNISDVYVKFYNSGRIAISPSTERIGYQDDVAEATGYTLIMPSNNGILKFYNEKIKPFALKRGYQSINDVPSEYMDYFLNSHMSTALVWPSRFKSSMNSNGEFFNGLGDKGKSFNEMNFKETAVASNGFMFALDDTSYIHPKHFETVFAQLLLDPDYSWMLNALSTYYGSSLMDEIMRSKLNGYNSENYILFLMSNTALQRNGYTMTQNDDGYVFTNTDAASGLLSSELRLKRLIQSCVFVRIKNDQMDNSLGNFLTNGQTTAPILPCFASYGFEVAVNYYGDMVRFKCPNAAAKQKKMQVQMLGKYDGAGSSSYLVANKLTDLQFNNGVVYSLGTQDLLDYCNSPVTWNENTLGYYLFDATYGACSINTNLSTWKKYALAVLFDLTNGIYSNPEEIDENDFVTVLIPNNTAMAKAVADGYLPAYESLNTAENIQKARNFLLNHFLQGRVYVNDLNSDKVIYSNREASFSTLITNPTFYVSQNQSMLVDVSKDPDDGCLRFQTSSSTSTVTGSPVRVVYTAGNPTSSIKQSNMFCRKGVIHEINGYLPCNPIMK